SRRRPASTSSPSVARGRCSRIRSARSAGRRSRCRRTSSSSHDPARTLSCSRLDGSSPLNRIEGMRVAPARLDRLPEPYFGALLGRVAAAADRGEPLVDLGRGNPETGPPPHVVEALSRAAGRADVHGYSPFRGLPDLRAALAERYRTVYGVELDPDAEVAVVPGTKTAIV